MPKTDFKKLADFVFEINNLKRLKHEGTRYAGVKSPDSLAEHIAVAAQIGFVLAELEGVDSSEVIKIILFHDNGEIRTGDHTRISDNYIESGPGERAAFEDSIKGLPESVRAKLTGLVARYDDRASKEYVVARDADLLETMFQAKEYMELGYPTKRWLENGKKYLKTNSAKKLFNAMEKKSLTDWWNNLNKV